MWIARKGAHSSCCWLSVPGKSIPIPIKSSKYILCVPLSLISMSTINSCPSQAGISSGKKEGAGTSSWLGAWSVEGSQLSS